MFGLIRKKKVIDALVFIAKEYDSDKQQPGMDKLNSFYYSCGNMNCANYIRTTIKERRKKKHEAD